MDEPIKSPIEDYYDSDYPALPPDDMPEAYGLVDPALLHDVDRYRELARACGGPVLEVFAGNGRAAIPIARDGSEVTAVDLSPEMLRQFRERLGHEPPDVRARVRLLEADARSVDAGGGFRFAFIAFNSLSLVDDLDGQRQVLRRISDHLQPGGVLAIDALNAMLFGGLYKDEGPRMQLTRRHHRTGRVYSRWGATSAFDERQRQRVYGWYDEVDEQGVVRRRFYSFHWRLFFRSEAELMLAAAGLRVVSVEGGPRREPFFSLSRRMFIVAEKVGS